MTCYKANLIYKGLPPGNFEIPITDMVLRGITLVGSIVGTRMDLKEAYEIAELGNVKPRIHKAKLEDINNIFDKMKKEEILGRYVITMNE